MTDRGHRRSRTEIVLTNIVLLAGVVLFWVVVGAALGRAFLLW